VSGRPDRPGRRLEGHLKASDVKAQVDGRPIAWQQPMAIDFSLRDATDGITVQTLKCQSPSLRSRPRAGRKSSPWPPVSTSAKLAAQLEQLVDLDGRVRQGEGWAYLNWKSPDRKGFSADLELQARDFRLTLPKLPLWEEPNLVLLLSSAGQLTGGVPARIQTASLRAKAAPDELEVRLLEPVPDWRSATSWPLEARMQGRLEAWPARLRSWIDLGQWKTAGVYNLSARGSSPPPKSRSTTPN